MRMKEGRGCPNIIKHAYGRCKVRSEGQEDAVRIVKVRCVLAIAAGHLLTTVRLSLATRHAH